jgi:hypothetical protein
MDIGRKQERVMRQPRMATRIMATGGLALLAACSTPVSAPVESLTVARVMGRDVEVPPLLPERGNSVWPSEDAPRGTIGNPDARVRPDQPPAGRNQARGSSIYPPVNDTYAGQPPGFQAPNLRPLNPAPAPLSPPPPRVDGRVIPTPGGPVVTSTGGPGYATYTTPEGATGIAIPQGGTTTLLDGRGGVRQVPTPR